MAKSDPPIVEGREQERFAHLSKMLNRFCAEIESIIDRLAEGDFAEASQLPKLKREMMYVSRQLREAEIAIDEQRKRDEGRGPGSGHINMGAARDALRSRLDRLRRAKRKGEVH